MNNDYLDVTELSGTYVSQEQIDRICHRYLWAGEYCNNLDVVEVGCGTGQGLGYLKEVSKTLVAGDYSDKIVAIAKKHYQDRVLIESYNALDMPYDDNSKDVIIIFETIYYLQSFEDFLKEVKRILRPNGMLLISTANKDLFDFNPSPYTYQYFGVSELNKILLENGFSPDFFGNTKLKDISLKQKFFRPIKSIAVKLNLIPKSMKGKKLLKKLVFGKAVLMPAEITPNMVNYQIPTKLENDKPDFMHKVILCAARLNK